ncbi:MAG: hypothetical protein JRJ43_07940 [Deltaproteobacteria bacterium]|nr:hypothetical protein [Deltaproteobacteria bacterium]MBW1719480.1 hypothetical protein [Deltaproteobacteria bacterium]MBW1932719.1 hypothetical protein [Deltaproteobacteria bacterium]MBW1939007.1 hypothetical protein [Deltaproteobacteria bacterium]MBW1964967.1 hypothetical protein [Deltaproteobacteria bacterium]
MPHPIGEALLKKESPRILRHKVRELLGSGNLEQVLRELKKIPQRKAINSLISVFYDRNSEKRGIPMNTNPSGEGHYGA